MAPDGQPLALTHTGKLIELATGGWGLRVRVCVGGGAPREGSARVWVCIVPAPAACTSWSECYALLLLLSPCSPLLTPSPLLPSSSPPAGEELIGPDARGLHLSPDGGSLLASTGKPLINAEGCPAPLGVGGTPTLSTLLWSALGFASSGAGGGVPGVGRGSTAPALVGPDGAPLMYGGQLLCLSSDKKSLVTQGGKPGGWERGLWV